MRIQQTNQPNFKRIEGRKIAADALPQIKAAIKKLNPQPKTVIKPVEKGSPFFNLDIATKFGSKEEVDLVQEIKPIVLPAIITRCF